MILLEKRNVSFRILKKAVGAPAGAKDPPARGEGSGRRNRLAFNETCREWEAFMTQTAIEIMSGDFIVWRCLHDGALTTNSIEQWGRQSDIP